MGGTPRTLSFRYNPDGSRSRMTHADGAMFGFDHDAVGRMTHNYEASAAPGEEDLIVRYWYYPDGRRQAAVRGAGSAGFTTVYYYDALLRPEAIINDLPAPGLSSGNARA